jgi:Protein of unknown function (DUF2878)
MPASPTLARCSRLPVEPRVLLNFAVFYVAWFACVLGAAHLHPVLGTLAVAAAAGLHLGLAPRPGIELRLLLATLGIGTVWDSALLDLGITHYATGLFAPGVAPHWIMALWVLFATTLNVSLAWLKGRWLLAAAFGAVGSPLSFFAGYRMGAVQMPDVPLGLAAQAIGWALILPLLCCIAARFDGFSPRTTL